MRSFLLILICVLLSLTIFGQSYQPFNANHESYFAYNGSGLYLYNDVIFPLRIDSTSMNPDGSVTHHHFRIFAERQDANGCYIINDTSWTGTETILTTNTALFYNKQQESITIHLDKQLGESWVIYTASNGDYLESTLTAKTIETFLGITDTVQTITLQAKDNTGNALPQHILNGKEIKISKNYGFVKAVNFADFPNDATELILEGHSNIPIGVKDIDFYDIFDFDIGDEKHITDHVFDITYMIQTAYIKLEVIDKDVYNNGDSLVYTLFRDQVIHTWTNATNTNDTTILQDTITEVYSKPFYFSAIDNPSFEFDTTDSLNTVYTPVLSQNSSTRLTKSLYTGVVFNGCWQGIIDGCINYQFFDGVGGPYNASCGSPDGLSLVYYKKGNELWGTPHNFDVLTSIQPVQPTNLDISISPNPMSEQTVFTVKNGYIHQKLTLRLFDVHGKQVRMISSNGNNQITLNREKLHTGFYFYRVDLEGKVVKSGKLIVH